MNHPTLSIFCPPDTPEETGKARLVAEHLRRLPADASPLAVDAIEASLAALLESAAEAENLQILRK
jgi:hypothetical protein